MKIVRNILISLAFIIVFIMFLIYADTEENDLKNGYYLDYGSWSTIRSVNDEEIFIGGILKCANDEKYIIAKRFPRIDYICNKPSSIESYFVHKIQYLIIDTKKNIVWATYKYKEFIKKKNKLGIQLRLSQKNTKTMRHQKWSDYSEDKKRIKYMKTYCKKKDEYPDIRIIE